MPCVTNAIMKLTLMSTFTFCVSNAESRSAWKKKFRMFLSLKATDFKPVICYSKAFARIVNNYCNSVAGASFLLPLSTMSQKSRFKNYDVLGILSSALCLVHCLVPSFIILGSNVAGDLVDHGTFDLIFFSISLLAVLFSTKRSSKNIRVLLWLSISSLGLTMLFEHLVIMEMISYLAAVSLIFAHLINLRALFLPGLPKIRA